MIGFTFDKDGLTMFGTRFRRAKERQLQVALSDIKREWHAEMLHQHHVLQHFWVPLSAKYARRKEREFRRAGIQNRPAKLGRFTLVPTTVNPGSNYSKVKDVKYLKTLQRSGKMLDRYLQGIAVSPSTYSVSIPYPEGAEGIRAMAHQGEINAPVGMPERRFVLKRGQGGYSGDAFLEIATKIMVRALTSDPKEGPYGGYQ